MDGKINNVAGCFRALFSFVIMKDKLGEMLIL